MLDLPFIGILWLLNSPIYMAGAFRHNIVQQKPSHPVDPFDQHFVPSIGSFLPLFALGLLLGLREVTPFPVNLMAVSSFPGPGSPFSVSATDESVRFLTFLEFPPSG
jgi:hypothetical protein